MTMMKSYSISNVNLQVEFENNLLAKRLMGAFDNYFFMTEDDSAPNSHSITLRVKSNVFSIKVPKAAQELSVSSSLRVLKDGDFCYLIGGNSLFHLNLRNTLGIGLLDSTFWERPLKSKQEFLMLALLWLLRQHGLYALHANGLVKDKVGVLFVGSSGSGKSTLSLSLIRQGWGYLSDDVILIRHSSVVSLSNPPDGIEAIAFLKGFSFDSNLANRYPELDRPLETPSLNGHRFDPSTSSGLTTGKRFLDISQIYPTRFQPSCFPKVLIFPKIVSNDKSELIPIDRAKALILLAENSGGIMVDKEMVVKQMEVLKGLVYQTSSYQLLLGRDLYEEPERISEILSGLSIQPRIDTNEHE